MAAGASERARRKGGRPLRQPDLGSTDRPRRVRRAATSTPTRAHGSNAKPGRRHLRPQSHETMPRQFPNPRDRRLDPTQPRFPRVRYRNRLGKRARYMHDHVVLRPEPASNNVARLTAAVLSRNTRRCLIALFAPWLGEVVSKRGRCLCSVVEPRTATACGWISMGVNIQGMISIAAA